MNVVKFSVVNSVVRYTYFQVTYRDMYTTTFRVYYLLRLLIHTYRDLGHLQEPSDISLGRGRPIVFDS